MEFFCIACSEGISWREVSLNSFGICGVSCRPQRTKRYRRVEMLIIFRRNVSHRSFKAASSKHTTSQFVNCSPKAAKIFCMIRGKKVCMCSWTFASVLTKLSCLIAINTMRYFTIKKAPLCAGFKKRCTWNHNVCYIWFLSPLLRFTQYTLAIRKLLIERDNLSFFHRLIIIASTHENSVRFSSHRKQHFSEKSYG